MPDEKEKPTSQGPDGRAEGKRVDEDWKKEAKRAKERLAKEESADEGGEPDSRRYALPKPSFELMVTNFAIQALIAMGEIANPVTRRQQRDLDQAKHAIDLLGVLEEKTKGNLTEDEKRHLDGTLYDLRMRYVALSRS